MSMAIRRAWLNQSTARGQPARSRRRRANPTSQPADVGVACEVTGARGQGDKGTRGLKVPLQAARVPRLPGPGYAGYRARWRAVHATAPSPVRAASVLDATMIFPTHLRCMRRVVQSQSLSAGRARIVASLALVGSAVQPCLCAAATMACTVQASLATTLWFRTAACISARALHFLPAASRTCQADVHVATLLPNHWASSPAPLRRPVSRVAFFPQSLPCLRASPPHLRSDGLLGLSLALPRFA